MNIQQATRQIEGAVRAYLSKDEHGIYRIPTQMQRPIIMMGPPGIGKTAIVSQIADRLGVNFVSYSITHHTRQSRCIDNRQCHNHCCQRRAECGHQRNRQAGGLVIGVGKKSVQSKNDSFCRSSSVSSGVASFSSRGVHLRAARFLFCDQKISKSWQKRSIERACDSYSGSLSQL